MTKPKPKPEIWWTIKHPEQSLFPRIVDRRRNGAIDHFMFGYSAHSDWPAARKAGYRAVKIKVTEV